MRLILPLLPAVLVLAACHSADNAPGSTTASEAQALNDAAAMLDANSVDANAVGIDDNTQEQPE